MAKKSGSNLSTPILYIILGVLLLVFKDDVLGWAMTAAGIVFIVSGAIDLSKGFKISAIISITAGIAILVLGWSLASIVLLVLGVLIAVKGAVDLLDALKMSKKRRSALHIVFPVLTIIVGLALAFANGIDYIIAGVGIMLIADGALGIISAKK